MGIILVDSLKSCTGKFAVEVYKKGVLQDRYADHNLVVDAGRNRLANLAAGLSTSAVKYIGLGSGSVKEGPADTKLQEQQLFPIDKVSVNGKDARFDFTIKENQANGLSVREFGLFCADKTMFSHRVRLSVNDDTQAEKVLTIDKAPDIEIRGYWVLHF